MKFFSRTSSRIEGVQVLSRKQVAFVGMLVTMLMMLASAPSFAQINRDEGMMPADGFFLSEGNAKSGEVTFRRLKCHACHWVQNNVDLQPPVAERVGSMIGKKQAMYAPGWIANCIVSPSHTIGWDTQGQSVEGDLSRMGDYSSMMTVRELMDLVAYIRSLGEYEPLAEEEEFDVKK